MEKVRTLPEIIAGMRKLGGVFTEFADELEALEQQVRERILALPSYGLINQCDKDSVMVS